MKGKKSQTPSEPSTSPENEKSLLQLEFQTFVSLTSDTNSRVLERGGFPPSKPKWDLQPKGQAPHASVYPSLSAPVRRDGKNAKARLGLRYGLETHVDNYLFNMKQCLWCWEPLPFDASPLRMFCSKSCRQKSSRSLLKERAEQKKPTTTKQK